ncbi:hypothetical protein DH2020_019406 [Rehmannia glutinosa]|uniref:Reverse transcriptase Ty1/copia-type domain-containing protein n=1 Tax=Rehmannia glutinosa TaxID=99300 RepID=A0ABR0WN14_REHGL
MEQLEGFVSPGQEKKVCKLVKPLYGLKQAPKFDMKDMSVADVILGINISKTSDGLTLSQSHYIETLLRKFNAYDSPPTKTLVDLSLHLEKIKVSLYLN